MNWLAKINLNIVVERLGAFKSALLLFGLIVICLFCGYRLGNFYHGFQEQKISQLQHRLKGLYQEQSKQTSLINTLEVELEVEKLASAKAAKLVAELEQEHYQVKKQLAFYEKVMAPEKQADGVVIDNYIVSPTTSNNHFRFQTILVQQKKSKRFANGYIEFSVKGSLAGKPKTLQLADISHLTKEQLSFNFQYFQIIKGEFQLPENFQPEQVQLKVTLPKGRWQKYDQLTESFNWPEIIENVENGK